MKLGKVSFWLGTAAGFLAVSITANSQWLGAILGYWFGFIYTGWLYRDTQRSTNSDTAYAVSRMRRSFFARLGLVTLIIAAVARFREDWLLYLAGGIAVGVILSLNLLILHLVKLKGGTHDE